MAESKKASGSKKKTGAAKKSAAKKTTTKKAPAKSTAAKASPKAWSMAFPSFEADKRDPELAVSPWAGHRSFAYDLVRFMEPESIVELGAHKGGSFFAFCQAVKDAKLSTELIAVDTWKGDEHAGAYGEEVFELFGKIVKECFAEQKVVLRRMLFEEAMAEVPDESIELLHIDGLHTYEAVKGDFESWLPKLAKNGVVLFHDTAEDTGYGSAEYWKDLKAEYKHFLEFPHSWGLGVLFPKGDALFKALKKNGIEDKLAAYEYQARWALNEIAVADKDAMLAERMQAIEEMNGRIATLIEEKEAILANSEKLIKEKDAAVDALNTRVGELEDVVKSMDKLVAEKDAAVAAQGKVSVERLKAMHDMEEMIRERNNKIAGLQWDISEKIKEVGAQKAMIEERWNAMQQMEGMIGERDAHIAELQAFIEKLKKYDPFLKAYNFYKSMV